MISDDRFAWLLDTRSRRPEEIAQRFRDRRRRPLLGDSGTLFLIAADHPARGALAVGGQPNAMANRRDVLDRLVVALERPGVDGVLASADLVEDLLLLGALDDKVVIGSMNRGGVAGAVFEADDRFTGYTPAAIAAWGLDGGKMLLRLALDHPHTVATMEACANAVTGLAEHGLMAMVEVFAASCSDGQMRVLDDTDATIRAITVAAGLGTTSAHTWLKIPVVDRMDEVLAASTLPAVLLGGDRIAEEADSSRWLRALAMPQARGVVVGRTLLYPPDGDVAGAVDALAKLVSEAKGLSPR